MKTIAITDDTPEICALLEQVEDEDVILQRADGSKFILSAVDDFAVEVAKTRQNPLMAFLDERAKEPATIPLAELKRQLGLS